MEIKNYKDTKVFKEATKSLKREIEEYKRQYSVSNQQMFLELRLFELNNLSKKEKRKPTTTGSVIIILVLIASWLGVFIAKDVVLASLSSFGMLFAGILFYSNIFSDSKTEMKKIRKELQNYPEIPEFNYEN